MLKVDVPLDDAEEVFASSAVHTRDRLLRDALMGQREHVADRAAEYLAFAADAELFMMQTVAPVGVTGTSLAAVYDRVLVRGAGRELYDRIRASTRFGRCPLCGQRDVKTVDHYLPQTAFPELAVFPANLVPSCSDCNHVKRAYQARTANDQLFHPYFDDWNGMRLLSARLEIGENVVTRFRIRGSDNLDAAIRARAGRHFDTLGLAQLYAQEAATELVARKGTFRSAYDDGEESLREELEIAASGWARINLNGWQAALYRALARSAPFIAGGFERIEE